MTAWRLVVWRHGQTDWNAERRFQGQSDVSLNAVGRAQAEAAAARLATLQPAAIVASDLSRAASTAAELAALTGLEVTYDPDLREIDVGSWAGLLTDEVRARWPDLEADARAGKDVRRGGDGERVSEVAERAAKAMQRAVELVGDDETVVVAGHGLSGGVGLAQFLGIPPLPAVFRGMHNCHWATAERGQAGWQVREWNVGAWPEPVVVEAG